MLINNHVDGDQYIHNIRVDCINNTNNNSFLVEVLRMSLGKEAFDILLIMLARSSEGF